MKILSIIVYLFLTVGGLILVKSGSNSINLAISKGIFNFSMGLKALLGFIFYIGSFVIYTFYIIKKFDLSYIYPIITGVTQILIILAGILLFKERLNIYGIFGVVLVIIGIIFLNIK